MISNTVLHKQSDKWQKSPYTNMSANELPITLKPTWIEQRETSLTLEVTKIAGHFITKSDVTSLSCDNMIMSTI